MSDSILSHRLIAAAYYCSAFDLPLDRLYLAPASFDGLYVAPDIDPTVHLPPLLQPLALAPIREFASVAFPSRHRADSKIATSILSRAWVAHKINSSILSGPLINS